MFTLVSPSASLLVEVWTDLPLKADTLGKRWCSKSYDAKWSQTQKSNV